MINFKIEIELLSDTLIGSGEGFGAVIDTDVVFDDVGIPYIPSKRIKGLIKDAAINSKKMLEISLQSFSITNPEDLFGKPGLEIPSPLKFSDLYLNEYKSNYEWMNYLTNQRDYKLYFSKDSVIDYFTNIRKSTTIHDDGVAKDHSLRTFRTLNKGLKFSGEIKLLTDKKEFTNLLVLACLNLKSMGTKRNRGLGEIKTTLFHNNINQNEILLEELEALCSE